MAPPPPLTQLQDAAGSASSKQRPEVHAVVLTGSGDVALRVVENRLKKEKRRGDLSATGAGAHGPIATLKRLDGERA